MSGGLHDAVLREAPVASRRVRVRERRRGTMCNDSRTNPSSESARSIFCGLLSSAGHIQQSSYLFTDDGKVSGMRSFFMILHALLGHALLVRCKRGQEESANVPLHWCVKKLVVVGYLVEGTLDEPSIPKPPALALPNVLVALVRRQFPSRPRTARRPLLSQRASESTATSHRGFAQNGDRRPKVLAPWKTSGHRVKCAYNCRSTAGGAKSQLQSKEQHEASPVMGQEGKRARGPRDAVLREVPVPGRRAECGGVDAVLCAATSGSTRALRRRGGWRVRGRGQESAHGKLGRRPSLGNVVKVNWRFDGRVDAHYDNFEENPYYIPSSIRQLPLATFTPLPKVQ
ncbi:hypothetical protein BJY52DRAFT_1414623 [Lactarius psammicola]|nr:hypothetical protein BJY52DRAFT_1414623 [Lactarius psammicola]